MFCAHFPHKKMEEFVYALCIYLKKFLTYDRINIEYGMWFEQG